MSISQVKKRFAEFQSYLGRDVVGLEKLKELKDAVNWVRTSLATAEHRVDELKIRNDELHLRVRDLEGENAEAAIDVQRHRQIAENLERELAALKATLVSDCDEADEPAVDTPHDEMQIKATLKRLRHMLRCCPAPVGVCKDAALPAESKVLVYDREEIAEGWTREALWTLGASVALLSCFFGVTVIQTDRRYKQSVNSLRPKDPNSNENTGRHFLSWLKNSIEQP